VNDWLPLVVIVSRNAAMKSAKIAAAIIKNPAPGFPEAGMKQHEPKFVNR
jgi:hypothetical protein